MISNYKLREMCIENNWFTCGNNTQYDRLFRMNESGKYSISQIALVIWLCSEDAEAVDIEIKLCNAGM